MKILKMKEFYLKKCANTAKYHVENWHSLDILRSSLKII